MVLPSRAQVAGPVSRDLTSQRDPKIDQHHLWSLQQCPTTGEIVPWWSRCHQHQRPTRAGYCLFAHRHHRPPTLLPETRLRLRQSVTLSRGRMDSTPKRAPLPASRLLPKANRQSFRSNRRSQPTRVLDRPGSTANQSSHRPRHRHRDWQRSSRLRLKAPWLRRDRPSPMAGFTNEEVHSRRFRARRARNPSN